MTTLNDVLATQKKHQLLAAPSQKPPAADTNGTTTFNLYNSTTSSTVYAYVTGLATNNNSATYLLEADGVTPYYPANPSSTGTPLAQNCAIPLGAVGSTTSITVPYTAGGRLWFSIGGTITFLLNPSSTGAQLVEPSSTNTADPNYNLSWDFCEFSYSSSEIYVNISYVDFVGIPIGLELTNTSGTVTHVSGLPANGLDTIANNLVAQNNKDGAGWDQLIIKASDGSNLRVLNPTGGIDFNPSLFQNYWSNYVDQIWSQYVSTPLVVDTQYTWGTVSGNTSNDRTSISFNGVGSFTKPGAADIFGQNTGPFAAQATNTAELLNIGARLSTAINRSTLLTDANQPDGESVASYYTNSVTNHYARIVHAANLDGRGYCFPYDDVGNSNEVDQSGYLSDPSPQTLLVTVGGGNASAKLRARLAAAEKPRTMKRSMVTWNEDVKEQLPEYHDLERGEHPKLMNEMAMATPEETSKFKLPSALERILGRYLEKIRSSPIYARIRPILELINQFFLAFLSLSLRAVLSRVAIIALVILFYFLGVEPRVTDVHTQRRILESAGLVDNGTLAVQGI